MPLSYIGMGMWVTPSEFEVLATAKQKPTSLVESAQEEALVIEEPKTPTKE